ncbi:MAG: CotH kinase family protein, partial [Bacteroidaceae bacterium]|nr:CotH kinase family protein [Bacteroidaceae bacterium]
MKKNLLTSLLLFAATTVGAQSWIDITSEYVRNTDYVSGNYDGWTFVGAAGSTATRCNAQEFWNGYWDFSQTVAVPQEGKYRVSVQGYYRVSDHSNENVTAYEEGTEDITCYLYANDDAVKMASIYSAFFTEDQGGTWRYGSGWGWWDDDVRFYPNTMETGTALFERGEYQNQLETTVGADRKLTIGIRNANQSNSNWTLFTNWKLEMYGTEVKMTKMAFEQTSARVTQGDELQMQLAITPSNATYQSVAYTSSNEAVATVDENGFVRTMKPGITTITATSTMYEDISCRCLVTVDANEVASASIIINEVQQANVDMFIDPSFNYGGWIELYNSTDSEVTLDGLYISDDRGHRMALTSSRHGTLPAKGFLALWFDHYSWWTPKTLNFKLDTDGGYIAISDAQGTVLSQFNYPPAITRTSYARTTDGGNEWGYTDQPTPGATNTTSKFATTRLAAPVIDHKGGLFNGHVTAVVTIPSRCTLRYTTDGSTPTMENGQTSAGGRFDFDKTTVLRLRLYKDGQLSSPVVTRSFILNDNDYTLPVLSLVSDPKNLTGNEYGIFARGSGNGRPGNGQSGKCNWNMDWDRPANVEYIGEDGQVAFNQEVSVEVSGGWSRAWTPQSFNIKANKMYEGVNRMDYQFFKNKPYLRHKGLKVRNGGNDYNNGRIKDAALQQVVATSGLYVETQSYQPVHVYRNGRYVGLLNLREPNNKNYGFANYGIDTDDEDMDQWKMSPDSGYVQQVGTRDVFDEWYSLSWNAADALTYERIKQIVDIEEMCNYLAVQFYLCGNDWPKNNIKAFRARTEGESNSRFRAILFDLDHAFNNGTNEFNWFFNQSQYWTFDQLYGSQVIAKYGNRITAEIEFVTIIKNMLENEEFKKQLIDQFCIVAGSVFEPKRSSEIVQGMIDRVAKDGFSATSGYDVKNKLSSSRQSSTVDNMRNYFGLGSAQNVTLSANIPEAGVMINGLNVPTNKFSGKLFAPITVTTAAPAGYRFVGWQSNLATTGTTIFGMSSDWNYYDQGSLDGEDWTAA